MTGSQDAAQPMESASDTLHRIFNTDASSVGMQMAEESTRYDAWQHATLPRPALTRRIAVANQKGGVGKTTSTVNVAASLAVKGAQVLVVDMDPQGNASTALGVPHSSGQPSVYEVLEGDMAMADVVAVCPQIPTLHVVPASIDLSGAELEVANLPNRNTLLKEALDAYLESTDIDYDYVFIDCPPSLGLLVINAMCAVTEMMIPIQAEYYALEGLGQLINTIGLVQQHFNPVLLVSTMLITMFDKRTLLSREVYNEVKGHYPSIVLDATIPRTVKISEAPSFSQSVVTYDPKGIGAISYGEAALEIARRSPSVLEAIEARRNNS